MNLKPKNITFESDGKYSFNEINFYKVKADSKIRKNQTSFKLDFDYGDSLELDLINFKKSKKSIANIIFSLHKDNKIINNKKFF